jgi:hypothetical protein
MLRALSLGVLLGLGLVLAGRLVAPQQAERTMMAAMARVVAPAAVGAAVGEAAGSQAAGLALALTANNVLALAFMALGGSALARLTRRAPPGPLTQRFYSAASRLLPPLGRVGAEDLDTCFLLNLFPSGGMALNGAVIGALLGASALEGVGGLVAFLGLFLPHAAVEVPALVLGAAVGAAVAGEVGEAMEGGGGVEGAVLRAPRDYLGLVAALCAAIVAAGVVEAWVIGW